MSTKQRAFKQNLEIPLTSFLENPDTNRSVKSEITDISNVIIFTHVVETSGKDFSMTPTDVSPNRPPNPNLCIHVLFGTKWQKKQKKMPLLQEKDHPVIALSTPLCIQTYTPN